LIAFGPPYNNEGVQRTARTAKSNDQRLSASICGESKTQNHSGIMTKDNKESLNKKIRFAEKEIAKGLIRWRLKRSGLPPLNEDALDRGTERIIGRLTILLSDAVNRS
jgi:hypothetical protein